MTRSQVESTRLELGEELELTTDGTDVTQEIQRQELTGELKSADDIAELPSLNEVSQTPVELNPPAGYFFTKTTPLLTEHDESTDASSRSHTKLGSMPEVEEIDLAEIPSSLAKMPVSEQSEASATQSQVESTRLELGEELELTTDDTDVTQEIQRQELIGELKSTDNVSELPFVDEALQASAELDLPAGQVTSIVLPLPSHDESVDALTDVKRPRSHIIAERVHTKTHLTPPFKLFFLGQIPIIMWVILIFIFAICVFVNQLIS